MHGSLSVGRLDEALFCFETPGCQGLSWILREAWLIDDNEMELILEVVGTCRATVAIIDSEVTALRPHCYILSTLRLSHIQNDRHPVFIIITLDSLMSVRCIRCNQAVCLGSEFGWLKVF